MLRPTRNFLVNDVVLLKDALLPRCDWCVCKVVETYPGEDNIVRSARLLVGNKRFSDEGVSSTSRYVNRSVHKILLLVEAE